ncbi:MAG: hypothetical protein B5M52_00015 [Helicobacteraceae bacterium 4484_230]|nr:MAG: hypothetical protein B5M52_00015 [Helicobacteraceae bacterium 4484_230]
MRKILIFLMVLALSASAASQAKKVRYMGNVKDLIVATQKTRGGTYNFLNGSEFAQFGVYENRSKIKNAFKAINRQFQVVGPEIDAEFDKLKKQMRALNKMAFQLEPLTSFKAYSSLVNKMITVAGKVQKNLFGNGTAFEQKASDLMMNKIMRLTEGLGKLRGLGSGIAARGECEDEEIDYMEEYAEEVAEYMGQVIDTMVNLNKNYGSKYPKGLNNQLVSYRNDVNKYVNLAKTKLIGQDNIKLDSNKYFAQGTSLISGAIKFYKMNEKALRE